MDHHTLEEAQREYEEERTAIGDQTVPRYIESYGGDDGVKAGETGSAALDLATPGSYQIYVWDGWRIAAFAAAHIEVVAAD